jgi:transcriptional regulator with XRE-family HTH domain
LARENRTSGGTCFLFGNSASYSSAQGLGQRVTDATYSGFTPTGRDTNTSNDVTVTDLRQRIGLRIRHIRLSAGLTQEALAEVAGLSYKFIGEVERGTGNPTVDSLAAIARALNVELTEFFRLTEKSTVTSVELTEADFTAIRDLLVNVEQILDRLMPARRLRPKRR